MDPQILLTRQKKYPLKRVYGLWNRIPQRNLQNCSAAALDMAEPSDVQ